MRKVKKVRGLLLVFSKLGPIGNFFWIQSPGGEAPPTVEQSKDSLLFEGKSQVEEVQVQEQVQVEAKEPNTDADNPKQDEVLQLHDLAHECRPLHELPDAEQSPECYLPTTTSHGIEFSYPSSAKQY